MPGIFISYRRSDGARCGRLKDFLKLRFGADRVFMDTDDIEPGETFSRVIEQELATCDVLIAAIGPEWIASQGRLQDPGDLVRREIGAAIGRKITLVPVLLGGTNAPRKEDLPSSLSELLERQVYEIGDTRFQRDIVPLVERLSEIVPEAAPVSDLRGGLSRLSGEIRDVVVAWLWIISRGHEALNKLERRRTLFFALRFMLYMVAAETVITLARGLARNNFWATFSLSAALTIQSFAAVLILHNVTKWFGGKASLQSSISAACFLLAYIPLIDVAQNPVLEAAACIYKQPDPVQALGKIRPAELTNATILTVVLSFLLATGLWSRFLSELFGSFRNTQGLEQPRLGLAFVFGFLAYAVFVFVFCKPFFDSAYQALECPPEFLAAGLDQELLSTPNVSGVWTRSGGSGATITQQGPTIRVFLEDSPGHTVAYAGTFGEGKQVGVASLNFQPQRVEDLFPSLPLEARQRLIDSGYSFRANIRILSDRYLELSIYSDDVKYEGSTGALSINPTRAPVKMILRRRNFP